MKFKYRKLSIALILLYVACMIFTAYSLFQLPDALIYKSQVLSTADLPDANPVFVQTYIVVGLTLIVGLIALAFSLNKANEEVIFVEKKKNAETNKDDQNEEEVKSHTLDISAIKDIVAQETDEYKLAKNILAHLCNHLEAGIGAFYKTSKEQDKRILEMRASYALTLGESQTVKYEFGEGLVGQAALEEKMIVIDDIPEGYIKIVSGLGNATPTHLIIVPIKHADQLYGVVEVASFTELNKKDAEMVGAAFKQLTNKILVDTKPKKADSKKEVSEDTSRKDTGKTTAGKGKKTDAKNKKGN